MKKQHLMILALMTLFSSVALGQNWKIEDGWKNIKVFKTDRSEVEKLLGNPVEINKRETTYKNGNVLIRIYYSAEKCCDPEYYGCGYNIPKDTVFSYEVIYSAEVILKQNVKL
jgi:hypothetical protein